MCFCTVIPAGALMCFHREVALKENSSLFQDTTAWGLDCHNRRALGTLQSLGVEKSISHSTSQAVQISTEGPQQVRPPCKILRQTQEAFCVHDFFFFENETDSAGGLNTQDFCKATHVKQPPLPHLGTISAVRLFQEAMAFTLEENILPASKLPV